jgi:hypothetical protein
MNMPNVPAPMGPELPGTKQVIVSFDLGRAALGEGSTRLCHTYLQMPFLPCGLLLWGVTRETVVNRIMVGNIIEGTADDAPIPGEYFAQGYTFEQIVAMAESNELDVNIAARQQLEMSAAGSGSALTLSVTGPCERACVWGRTFTEGRPYERATVEQNGDRFTARIDRFDLRGVDTVLHACASTELGAIALLAALALRSGRV